LNSSGYGVNDWPEARQLSEGATHAILGHCLSEFSIVSLEVTGDCMAPALPPGRRVSLSRRTPRIGDVVLARHARGLVLHRLVWGPPLAWRGAWCTMADQGQAWDGQLSPRDVVATVLGAADPWRAMRSLAVGLAARAREIFTR
jgi:hypothetical protein